MNRRSVRLALVLALAGAMAATGLGTSAQAAGMTGSRAPTASELATAHPAAHALASTKVSVVVRVYDQGGHLVSKRVVRSGEAQRGAEQGNATPSKDCSLLCHFVGCAASSCPDSGGHARIDVIQKGYSTLGADLWSWDVWTKWSWNHRGCPCTVRLIDKGRVGKALDQFWAYDGIVGKDQHYVAGGGGPHTAYHNNVTGQFHGPGPVPGHDVYRRPTNILNSYNNGTFEWWKSCC